MAAPKGNKNRQLGEEPLDAQLILRVTKAEKQAWNSAARPGPLAQWVRDRLNEAALESKIINPADIPD
jgi:hypothetical protein